MPKTFSAPMRLHLTRSTTTLATCMRIVRRDGNIYGFTTNRKQLVIAGTIYEPAASFNPTDIASANNMDTDNLTVEAFLDSLAITEDDVRATRWDFAAYRIFQVNYNDLSMGDKKDRAGHLAEVTVNRQTLVGEMLGLMEAYTNSIGDITQALCRNDLGDVKCGVSLAGSPTRTVTGTIDESLSDYFTLIDTARTEPDAWFDEGTITLSFPTGALSYEIKAYVLSGNLGRPTFVTKTPFHYDATGVAYTMTQGCRRRFLEDCVATFNNGRRFNGEPWLRGPDVAVQVGRRS